LLMATSFYRTRSVFQRMITVLGLEAAIWGALLYLVGGFASQHLQEPRFLAPAILLALFPIANLMTLGMQIHRAGGIDHAQPIADIQRQFEEVRILRARATRWSLIMGILVWPAFLVVILKASLGLDAYPIGNGTWLLANVIFSVVCVLLAIWISKKYAPRLAGHPVAQSLMNDLIGYNLNSAARQLAEIAEFQKESASADASPEVPSAR